MFKQFSNRTVLHKDKEEQLMKLEDFKTLQTPVVVGLNFIPLNLNEEENQLIKYSW